jgi:hypothetical protein
MIDFDQEWIARLSVLRTLNDCWVAHCGWCNRPMREDCRCGATPAKDMLVETAETPADEEKPPSGYMSRPPLL